MKELFLDKFKVALYELYKLGIERQVVGGIVSYSFNNRIANKKDIDQLIDDLTTSFRSKEQYVVFKWADPKKIVNPTFYSSSSIGKVFNTQPDPYKNYTYLVEWFSLLKNVDVSEADNIYRHLLLDYDMSQLITLSQGNTDLMAAFINIVMNPTNKSEILKRKNDTDLRDTFEVLENIKIGNIVAQSLYSYVDQYKDYIASIHDPEEYHTLCNSIIKFVRNNFDKKYWTDFTKLLNNNSLATQHNIISDNDTKVKIFNISIPDIYQQYFPIMMFDDIQKAFSLFNIVINNPYFLLDSWAYRVDSPSTIILTLESRDESAFTLFKNVFHDILNHYSSEMLNYLQVQDENKPLTKLHFEFENHMVAFIDSLALRYELNNQPLQVNKTKVKI